MIDIVGRQRRAVWRGPYNFTLSYLLDRRAPIHLITISFITINVGVSASVKYNSFPWLAFDPRLMTLRCVDIAVYQ